MKKKFINGILMAALVFAASTSFVSCKDNVTDEIEQVYSNLEKVRSDLQGKIDDLNTRVDTLSIHVAQHDGKITEINTDIKNIRIRIGNLSDTCKYLYDSVEVINNQITVIDKKINELESWTRNLVTQVIIQKTYDNIIGTFNVPGINAKTLSAYYGQNMTHIDQFPVAGKDYNVDPSNVIKSLTSDEIAVEPIDFEVTDFNDIPGNAGKVYFTVNPNTIDISKIKFDIVDGTGKATPIVLSTPEKTTDAMTIEMGKSAAGPVQADSSSYIYEASATIPVEDVESMSLPYMSVLTMTANSTREQVANIMNNLFNGSITLSVAKEALKWLQNSYSALSTLGRDVNYTALRASWTAIDTNHNPVPMEVVSPCEIASVTVKPLSYNLFWTLDYKTQDAANKVVKTAAKAAAYMFAKLAVTLYQTAIETGEATTGKDLDDFTITEIKHTAGDPYRKHSGKGLWYFNGTKWVFDKDMEYTYANDDYTYVWVTLENGKGVLASIPMVEEMAKEIFNNHGPLENFFNTMRAAYNAAYSNKKLAAGGVALKLSSYLDKFANKICQELYVDNPIYTAVAPMLLFNSTEGVDRIISGIKLNVTGGDAVSFIMTSPTQEIFVPVLYKYIAVKQNGKIVDAKLCKGTDLVADLNLPEGACEIIFQTMDYSGYTSAERFDIFVVK